MRARAVPAPAALAAAAAAAAIVIATASVAAASPPTAAPSASYPLAATVAQATKLALAAPIPTPSGVTQQTYLEQIAGTFHHFTQFQDLNTSSIQLGRIIDPYAGEEIQYSTPCFAYAGASLLHYGYYADNATARNFTLSRVSLAMTAALTSLKFGQPVGDQGCAQGVSVRRWRHRCDTV